MKLPIFLLCLSFVICSHGTILTGLDATAWASRMHRPMGDYVREAELIVVGEAKTITDPVYSHVLRVQEVIKGNQDYQGKEIVISPSVRTTADAHIPDFPQVAVLLKKNWEQKDDRSPVLEVYQTTEDLSALRRLVVIAQLPTERDRLLALLEDFAQGNSALQEQFFADVSAMRDPANWDLLLNAHKSFKPIDQKKLLEQMAIMNDLRAVPVLIEALGSADKEVATTAAGKLYYQFPGAEGVTEAFKNFRANPDLEWYTTRYLAEYVADPQARAKLQSEETIVVQAERLMTEGKKEAARALYFKILEGADHFPERLTNDYARRKAALKLLLEATPEEKDRIRVVVLPLITRSLSEPNYYYGEDDARILHDLRTPDGLNALIAILKTSSTSYLSPNQTAAMAIRELGAEAEHKAVAQIIQWLKDKPGPEYFPRWTDPLLALIWLGTDDEVTQAEAVMLEGYRNIWTQLSLLRPLRRMADEKTFLMDVLKNHRELSYNVNPWIYGRLIDFKDSDVVEFLAQSFEPNLYNGSVQSIVEALVAIGGPQVEAHMLKLLEEYRAKPELAQYPSSVLFRIQGAGALDLARRMIKEDSFGSKQEAIMYLGRYGNPEDLEILVPYTNYWTGDRRFHYWATSAVGEIRRRHHYDVNGPIIPKEQSRPMPVEAS